jgi:hypothetical protein
VAGTWDEKRALAALRRPPSPQDLADWRLGARLREHFPPGGGAFCLRREVVAYAGRVYCPYTSGLDYGAAAEPVRAHLAAECGGEGPVPFVVLAGVEDGASASHRAMSAWVEANASLVTTFESEPYSARVYAVERP